jgi:glycosyltransferase involved in cell wall biosynthesis
MIRGVLRTGAAKLRARLRGLVKGESPDAKFRTIYEQNLWRGIISRSGSGSDLEQTAVIRRELPRLIGSLGVRSILDAPCGDFYWMKEVELPVERFIGGDIVSDVVRRNQEAFTTGTRRFINLNILRDDLPRVELIFCRDCLVHLSFEDISKAIKNFQRSGARYLLTTTFPGRTNIDIATGLWRPLDLQSAPFDFPTPVELINENCTEDNGLYADKSLGLWELGDLAIREVRIEMGKIRVLLLLHDLSQTGAPTIGLEIFEALADQTQIRIIAGAGGPQQSRAERLGPVSLMQQEGASFWKRQIRRLTKPLVAGRRLWWKPDLIYANSVASLVRIASRVTLPPAPMLLHVHETGLPLKQSVSGCDQLFRNRPQKYIAPSQNVADAMSVEYHIPADRITVIPSFVSDQEFQAVSGIDGSQSARAFTVGGCGTPGWVKGGLLWLQSAVELGKILGKENVRFVWVGMREDAPSDEFRAIARKLQIDDVVTFVPETPDVLDQFKQFDAFAMTSWEESASIVTLQNMMLAKPVVCFADSGGPPHLVCDTGLLVEAYSPLRMAEALATLARSPELRGRLGNAARERVRKNFLRSGQIPAFRQQIAAAAQG